MNGRTTTYGACVGCGRYVGVIYTYVPSTLHRLTCEACVYHGRTR